MNSPADRRDIADAVARAVHRFDPDLILYTLPGIEQISTAVSVGLGDVKEIFADRLCSSDGRLARRNQRVSVMAPKLLSRSDELLNLRK